MEELDWVNKTCRKLGVSRGRDVFIGNGKVVIVEDMSRYGGRGDVDAQIIEYPLKDVIIHVTGQDVQLKFNRL